MRTLGTIQQATTRLIVANEGVTKLRQYQRPTFISVNTKNKWKAMSTVEGEGEGEGESVGVQSVKKDEDELIVQYVVLRRDLIDTWPLGSIVTQGCHASVAAVWENKDDPYTLSYCSPSRIHAMHKVTLEVKGETQLMNLSEKLQADGVIHKLWIEFPENYPTCLATKPYAKSFVSSFFKKLKLCK